MNIKEILLFISLLIFSPISMFGQDYNIVDFGAIPDGKTLNTEAIQSTIDSAFNNGGGRVIFPKGLFLSGMIVLKSGIELHLQKEAVLLGSINPAHYKRTNRWKALVMADNQTNIGITGLGVIDGQGRQLALNVDSLFYAGQIDSSQYNFVEMRPKEYLRPQLIEFVECTNIEIRNISLKNASCWVQTYDKCENIIIDSIDVYSDAYWNNDGIDISDCKNVRITNSIINTGDDGICLKSHSEKHYCDSIYIANCTVRSSASAIKFGTRSSGGFRNVVIENIKVYDTFRSAIAIECVDGGVLENVLVQNIKAVNTGNAIFIRLAKRYKNKPASTLRNVKIKNLKVEIAFERPDYKYDIRGPALPFFHNIFPSSVTGIPGHPVENVSLENIEIIYPGRGNNGMANRPLDRLDQVPENVSEYPEFSMFGELPCWGLYVRHMDGLSLKNIKLSIDAPDYRPSMVFDQVNNLTMQHILIQGDNKEKDIILHKTENAIIDNMKSVLKMEPISNE
jgi:hypothetical protein